MKYLDFICTKEDFSGCPDAKIQEFDAYRYYDLLTEFYDSCPECESFPKEEYFPEGPRQDWVDYVIWRDGRIVARAGIWMAADEAWEVAGVITRPEYRNRGYSAQLVSHCIAKILAEGKMAILSTAETNLPMIRAAQKAGFKRVETEK